jgi:hypothetical protein
MELENWISKIVKFKLDDVVVKFSFMIPKFENLGLLEANSENNSVTIIKTGISVYPEDYEDLIILLNDYNTDENKCEVEECCGIDLKKDLKQEFKDEFNGLIKQLNYIQEEIEQITRQKSDLKVGFLSGQLFSDIGNLKMRFWELENKLNNL